MVPWAGMTGQWQTALADGQEPWEVVTGDTGVVAVTGLTGVLWLTTEVCDGDG